MGAGASVQRGPPGLDGKDGQPGKDGKDAIVDYIQLVSKTVADDSFKAQIKALLNDNAFRTIVTDFMNANVGTFKGPKGETEFKNLTAEEQSQIISKLVNDNMTTFAVQLMANNSFKDAIVKMLESNPTNFRGPQGVQGPQGIGIKDANYDSATGNLMFTRTDNSTIGSFMVRGAEGRPGTPGAPGPAGNIQSAENVAWLQGKTMWCADGSCLVPNGNAIKNKLIRLGTFPDDQSGMAAQGEGLFIKSGVAANTPSTLIKIGDSNYPESGNPEMVFTGFAGGNAYSSSIRSGKGTDLQFITNGETRAIMNADALNVTNGLNVKGNLVLGEGKEKNKWILHTPDDDRKSLYIAFRNKDLAGGKGDWDWEKQVQVTSTGDVSMNGNLSINKGYLNIDKGQTNDLALALRSSGAGWGSGMQFINTAQGGKNYGIYSGSDGALHFADNAAGQDRVVIKGSEVQVPGNAVVNFGAGFTKQEHAGRIGYGTFDGGENGSLNIVGGGKTQEQRKITAWAEGGFEIKGPLIVNGRNILAELDKAVKTDNDGKVNIPSGKLKIKDWDLDSTDGMLRYKLGSDQIFVLHNDSWNNSSAWIRGSYYSNKYNRFL